MNAFSSVYNLTKSLALLLLLIVAVTATSTTDWNRPRLALSNRCSGSSAIFKMLREIIGEMGYNIYERNCTRHCAEFLYNHQFNATKSKVTESKNNNMTVVAITHTFKGRPEGGHVAQMHLGNDYVKFFQDEGFAFANIWRSNSLDRVICSIHDGLAKQDLGHHMGTSINSTTGLEVHQHFKSRSSGRPMVQIDTTHLVTVLREMLKSGEYQDMLLKTSNLSAKLVKYEDLMAFQYDAQSATNKGKSLIAWLQVLQDLKVRVDRSKLDEFLRGNFGRFHAPTPHSISILNFKEVEEVLGKEELKFLLRYT